MLGLNRNEMIQFVVVVLILCVAGQYVYFSLPIWKTRSIVQREARQILHDIQTGANSSHEQDAWGQPLRYKNEIEPEYIYVSVSSDGPDGKPNTGDDIMGETQDLNKSRIVGKWVGKKLKQASDGLVEGLKEKTVFDKATEEKRPETKETKKKWLDYFKFKKDEDEKQQEKEK